MVPIQRAYHTRALVQIEDRIANPPAPLPFNETELEAGLNVTDDDLGDEDDDLGDEKEAGTHTEL